MSMDDKILDDDDIIDLTDLLEEGESSKKDKPRGEKAARPKAALNEPDSFDLGKEISMEYDVSVEELDHAGDTLDIDAKLSSSEEVALTEDKPAEAALVEEEKIVLAEEAAEPVLEEALAEEPVLEETQAALADEEKAVLEETKLEEAPLDLIEEPAPVEVVEEPAPVPAQEAAAEEVLPAEQPASEIPMPVVAVAPAREQAPKAQADGMMEIEYDTRDVDDVKAAPGIAAELKKQAPAIIEAIVRPLMAELVRDMIAATREQLPSILEKVVREEIEKLKKLES
jgi:hypothetical protein